MDSNLTTATADTVPESRPNSLTPLIDLGERLVFVVALAFFYIANARSHELASILVVINNGTMVFFILFRRRASAISLDPLDWALALIGTFGGMLMRPGGSPLIPQAAAAVLVLDGFAIELAAKLSLNRSFGIAPAIRGIQARWAYRVIRHPMYLGYLLINTGYVFANPTFYNLGVVTLTCGCQIGRILREEKFLLGDPAYRAYAEQVRFRLVPLLF
jgi:protein-S-isoprenylcysteine O-methyltransferase Ste14